MKIKYLAHSSFLITAEDGIRIITDPYDKSVGYRIPEEMAEIVTSSHDHFDHAYFDAVTGSFDKITTPGERVVKGIRIKGVQTAHDEASGSLRGSNIIFIMEVDGMHIAHLGDLGHIPNHYQIQEIGTVDVLITPIGGHFTIDTKQAKQVADLLKPKVVIPMHYKTPAMNFPIATVDEFIKLYDKVFRPNVSEKEITKENLPLQKEILVLEPSCMK